MLKMINKMHRWCYG